MLIQFKKEVFNTAYIPLLSSKHRYKIIYGGAGSGKSFFVAQRFLSYLLSPGRNTMVLMRKVARTIRHSSYRQIKELINLYKLDNYVHYSDSALVIKSKINKNEIFCLGLDDRGKIKSLVNVNKVWIEEATEIDHEDFLQIDLRLRGEEGFKEIYMTFNPINSEHWLNKIKLQNSIKIRTTYKHNKFIDNEYKQILENLKDQNIDYYNVYCLGLWGKLEETVYSPFTTYVLEPSNPEQTIYGLDFGYNVPTALIRINIKDDTYYVKELIYQTKLTNTELIEKLKQLNINPDDYIYCDSQEPARITEICEAGFNAHPADKSVKDGIDFIKGIHHKIRLHRESSNIQKEVTAYSYKKTKDGKILDEVIKDKDHALDALRYALYTHLKGTNVNNFKIAFI